MVAARARSGEGMALPGFCSVGFALPALQALRAGLQLLQALPRDSRTGFHSKGLSRRALRLAARAGTGRARTPVEKENP